MHLPNLLQNASFMRLDEQEMEGVMLVNATAQLREDTSCTGCFQAEEGEGDYETT